MNLNSIRRALKAKGLTPATLVPEASGGRGEEATIRLARLVEGDSLRVIPVGPPEPWPGSLAYLDGVQRSEVVGYAGSTPIVVAEIAAAVRERHDRRLHTVLEERRTLALGRPAALAKAGDALGQMEAVSLPEDEPAHPVRDLVQVAFDHVGLNVRDYAASRSFYEQALAPLGKWWTSQCTATAAKDEEFQRLAAASASRAWRRRRELPARPVGDGRVDRRSGRGDRRPRRT